MKPLHPVYGHAALRQGLAQAITAGRLPQALLLDGPRGVGKQRLALWIAQRLTCEAPQQSGEPCGQCRPCKLVLGLAHPDVHWFIPIEPPKRSTDADKMVELAEEALAEALAARREQPLYQPPGGMAAHGMASIRLLLRRQALTPALGGPRVFVIGDAERLLPQTGHAEAANALLKALEEPPARTWFILAAAEPQLLPATVLSRVVRLRVPRLPDSVVTVFLQEQMATSPGTRIAAGAVAAAEGCLGRILATGRAGTAPVSPFLEAARGDRVDRYAWALAQPPFEARGAFTEMLDGLLVRLRAEAAAGGDTRTLVEAIARVLETRAAAQGNVNPQLLAAVLGDDIAAARASA